MLLENYRKPIKQYFWWEKKIREEISMTKRELALKKHGKTSVGIDDPTGAFVVRKNSELKEVVIYINGKRVVVSNPEAWMRVVRETYALYCTHPVAGLIQERINTGKSVDVLSGLLGISNETYHRWEREFFDDANFIAAKAGLYRSEKKLKKIKKCYTFLAKRCVRILV